MQLGKSTQEGAVPIGGGYRQDKDSPRDVSTCRNTASANSAPRGPSGGFAWGRLPSFLIETELQNKQLISAPLKGIAKRLTLAVANYRSIRSLVVPLGNLTLVTGANGSGKSNLYRALRLLAEAAQGGIVRLWPKRAVLRLPCGRGQSSSRDA